MVGAAIVPEAVARVHHATLEDVGPALSARLASGYRSEALAANDPCAKCRLSREPVRIRTREGVDAAMKAAGFDVSHIGVPPRTIT